MVSIDAPLSAQQRIPSAEQQQQQQSSAPSSTTNMNKSPPLNAQNGRNSNSPSSMMMIQPDFNGSDSPGNGVGGGGDEDDDPPSSNNNKGGTKNRRQKRLERNRESARLSRRRRKQYLEVLEERVSQLSEEMDRGRRDHAAQAVRTVRAKRASHAAALAGGQQQLQQYSQQQQQQQQFQSNHPNNNSTLYLSPVLHRTSAELKVAALFCAKQLKSFCAPPAYKFVLWLTLQADDFFRGGRAASERLSAARIGERMLNNGTDRATPAQTMWPLFCNEIGLSYDQEEKVRNYQRSLLGVPETWLSRHASFAGVSAMASAHEATQALALSIGNRERHAASVLTDQQRAKLMAYMASKLHSHPGSTAGSQTLHRLRAPISMFADGSGSNTSQQQEESNGKAYELSKSYHVAANLYILNHRLSKLLLKVPRAAPMVTGPALKKLSRRPSFESLGARSGEKSHETDASSLSSSQQKPLSRESNCGTSSGSLKRSASEMSVDDSNDERQSHRPSVDPVAAQANASETIEKTLGHVKEIIPPTTNSNVVSVYGPQNTRPDVAMSSSYAASAAPKDDVDLADVDPDLMRLNGEPLPDPVPVAVLSSTPAPTPFLVPLTSMGHHNMNMHNASAFLLQQAQYSTTTSPLFGEPDPKQRRSVSSGCLGVVPEEIWSSEAAEDFLMSFVDEDWAIGGGVETDSDM
ncbi:hypothetical protein ACA910_014633 [Epithemia clementina (nom. ined.)]